MTRKSRPLKIRILNAISSFTLIGTSVYLFFTGINLFACAIIAVATLTIITPVAIDGGRVLELLSGIFEAFLDGVITIFETIANIFNF